MEGNHEKARQLLDEKGTAAIDVNAAFAIRRPRGSYATEIFSPHSATALFVACEKGHLEVVSLLLSLAATDAHKGREDDEGNRSTPLSAACRARNVEVVTMLLAKGIDPNRGDLYRNPMCGTNSPARACCLEDSPRCLKLLLDAGAHIEEGFADEDGAETPLRSAMAAMRLECAKVLLSAGASINGRCYYRHGCDDEGDDGCDGGSALCLACLKEMFKYGGNGGSAQYKPIVQLLLDNGADVCRTLSHDDNTSSLRELFNGEVL